MTDEFHVADETTEITVNPQIMLLEQVLGEMAAGRLRVPRFQRPFVWRPDQMLNLFDSIERGYPIGSLLVWDTTRPIPSLDRVADIEIPSQPPNSEVGFVLDGHQRLSTLFGSLQRRSTKDGPQSQREWMWNVYRVLGDRDQSSDLFRHWKRPDDPPSRYLPMRSVLRTMDFLAYSRRLSEAIVDPDVLADLVDEAEQLAHRIKSYQVAVVRLKSGDLRHAVEVFSRLNSSGQSMTPDQMVSALTFQAEGDSLADRIEAMREDLGAIGYGQVTSITIFRSILAVAGEKDVMNARWEVLAARVRGNLAKAIEDTQEALYNAVIFLLERVGVPLARLVPYQHQIMMLTAFFHGNPNPSESQLRTLIQWFWGTSWSGFFAGANTTQVKNSLQQMKDFASGYADSPWEPQNARPFPDKFDLRSARVRAFIIWELGEFKYRRARGGGTIDPVEALAKSDAEAYQHVVRRVPERVPSSEQIDLPDRAGCFCSARPIGTLSRRRGGRVG